jgi:hypothetical protein
MTDLNRHDRLFVLTAFLIQAALLIFFALRKYDFQAAMRVGWIIYALALPAVIVSILLIGAARPWFLWIAGFLYAGWAIFAYEVDIAHPVEWRSPILWPVFIPYVLLYVSGLVFYWWPLATIQRSLWFIYAVLFVVSTVLNVSSHF